MHPDDAAVSDRRWAAVTVRSRSERWWPPVEVTDSVRAGVVSLPYGWGHDADGARLSVASADGPG
jgi:hypothetical protein